MGAVVSDVSHLKQPVVGKLVLQVEGPILSVGQLVVGIVPAKLEGAKMVGRGEVSRSGLGLGLGK